MEGLTVGMACLGCLIAGWASGAMAVGVGRILKANRDCIKFNCPYHPDKELHTGECNDNT